MSISLVRMARWSVWRSPFVLPLSRMEVPTATAVRRCSSSTIPMVRQAYSDSSFVRSFNEIPGLWKNGVANLYNFWKLDGFRNLHRIMVQNFNTFGPIYRYRQTNALELCKHVSLEQCSQNKNKIVVLGNILSQSSRPHELNIGLFFSYQRKNRLL